MTKHPVTPNQVMPDNVDYVQTNGVAIRKGTMAAAIANIEIIESLTSTQAEKAAALEAIKALVPQLKAFHIHKHLQWRNPQIEALFTTD